MTTTHEAIGELLNELTAAWNDGDAARYAQAFTEDADYITFFGLRMRGRQAIEDGHRELFKLPIKLDPATGAAADVKTLGDGVALIISGGTSTVDGEADPTRDSVISLTAVRTPDGWRFASFQNTRVSDPRAAR